jgi:succinate dehydrogenase/fumarate reductase flavoprotein subunit
MPIVFAPRFPTIAEMCRQVGLDLARDRIPVGPAAHYVMGGIDTDEMGPDLDPGLFAAGETACTGVHGANRWRATRYSKDSSSALGRRRRCSSRCRRRRSNRIAARPRTSCGAERRQRGYDSFPRSTKFAT